MKKLYERIASNARQMLELIVLIGSALIPWIIDLHALFDDYLRSQPLSPGDDFWWQIALRIGQPVASFIIFIAVLIVIRKVNHGFVMNSKLIYHDYSYTWYWICSKILGITSCNLVRVPIYMQFKLVIRATFSEYPLDEKEFPTIENEPDSSIYELHSEMSCEEVNLVLEDTYTITDQQIPKSKRGCRTYKISRNGGTYGSRHFSQKYIDEIIQCIRGLKRRVVVNVYATTNPANTIYIAKRVFGLGERGNVKHLYVFQQGKDGIRRFEKRGRKIF